MITTIKSIFILILKIIISLVLLIFLILAVLYSGTTIYNFPQTKPFAGSEIFNPYNTQDSIQYKANFHAHTYSWYGLTHGGNTDKEVYDAYMKKGYDIACISNYHKISTYHSALTPLYIPAYEHGYNVNKAHYLVINAEKVSYGDFPLWQSSSHQQTIIDVLRKNAEIVTIAHPKFGGGRSYENIRTIVGYHLMEVLNHYRNSEAFWDQALSVGKLSWIIGNDDIHDLQDPTIFKIWNIIFSNTYSRDSILSNLKKGNNYVVQSENGSTENSFVSCIKKDENTFRFNFGNEVDTILFIGQNGDIKQINTKTKSAQYSFVTADTYVRVVAHNKKSSIFLNPLFRYDGIKLPYVANLNATKNLFLTWICRLFFISLAMFTIMAWKKVIFLNTNPDNNIEM